MIKGWKLNPEWVRLMAEKKKAKFERKIQMVKAQHDLDMVKLRELAQKADAQQQKGLLPGTIRWLNPGEDIFS